jgi:hypothetical protein
MPTAGNPTAMLKMRAARNTFFISKPPFNIDKDMGWKRLSAADGQYPSDRPRTLADRHLDNGAGGGITANPKGIVKK